MNLTAAYCKAILDTLPIGYYLEKPVDVKLSLIADTSMCDMQSETIIISYPAIAKSLEAAPETDDPEWQVRTHLYHEISHLLLTPKKINRHAYQLASKKYPDLKNMVNDIMNIMEDERIETIMKHHFMNVDFEKSLTLENPSPEELLTRPDPLANFFAAVRFHKHPNQAALRNIERALEKAFPIYNSMTDFITECTTYINSTLRIFQKYFYQSTQENQESENGDGENQESENNGNKNQETDDQNNESDLQGQSFEQAADNMQSPVNSKPEPLQMTNSERRRMDRSKEEFEAAIEAAIQLLDIKAQIHDAANKCLTNAAIGQITTRMKKIIQTAMNRRAMQAPSSSAYAGKIDPRLTANKDYRWFIKSNKGSDGNKFSKIKVNLFVDCSGSFTEAMPKINAIIKAFREVKNQLPEFDYDIVAMECGEWKVPKSTLSLEAMGGNLLDNKIHDLYRQVQTPNARVANVVVFDGFAWTELSWNYERIPEEERKNAGAFNHPNCIIVTDDNNEAAFTEYAPQAKRIVLNRNYAKVFTDKVFESLERLLA